MTNLNTSHDWHPRSRRFFKWLWAGLVALCCAVTTQALDPNRTMQDYIRTRWDIQQGFPGGPVYAIAQTPDGYLWLGTENGLVRFDGLNFRLFNHTNLSIFPPGPVLDLMTDAEGNLWIRPQGRTTLRYRDGVFQDITPALNPAYSGVTAMCRGAKGEALFEVLGVGIISYSSGVFSTLVTATTQSNVLIISMAQTGDGTIWMGTRDAGLFYSNDGRMASVTTELPDKKINRLLVVGDRELWIGTDNGVAHWDSNEPRATKVPDALDHTQILSLMKDHESNLWIGTPMGLLRLDANASPLGTKDMREATGVVNAIFEDREGNLWVGSAQGIERFRDSIFLTYPVSKNQSSPGNGAVYVDADGRTWFAPAEGGLYWRKDGQTGEVTEAGLNHDVVYSLTGSRGELWIGRQHGGLTRLRYQGNTFAAETYTQAQGLVPSSIYAVYQSRDGTVWAGSTRSGLSRFKDGKFTNYTSANGMASNMVTSLLEGADGALWVGTANGLCALSQNHWTVYSGVDGLPSGSVNCLLEDSDDAIWIGTDSGIAVLRSGQVEVPSALPDSLHAPILGMVADAQHAFWISTPNRVLRIDRDKLVNGAASDVDAREFSRADGLLSANGVKRCRSMVADPLGRIWVSTTQGLSVAAPWQVAGSSVPALVHIEGVAADGAAVDLQGAIHIPGARQRITFNYAGLSLTVPERVRFRYKLDSFDKDWSEAVTTREAVYTNLSPGTYRFRVIASNSDGLWNGPESTIQFEIEPVFWQTWWFRLAGVMAIAAIVLVFYRLRLRRVTQQLNMRFEERLAERTRIAQDLHDTLLQGFLSASMQLDVAADLLPTESPAKPLVSRVLELMRQVIDEGRTTLRGLRSSDLDPHDLAESFAGIQDELALHEHIDYQVVVNGQSRPLRPVIRDEIYRIGREALVNAFRHARASKIEIAFEYGARQLRISVRDNGCGITPKVLQLGRDGHFGLSGMRERAEAVGARLKIWSGVDGTEVEILLPGDIAFLPLPGRRRSRFAGFYRRRLKSVVAKIRKPDQ